MKEDREQKERTVRFDDNNVLGFWIDKPASMLGKHPAQQKQSNHLNIECIMVKDDLW